MEIFAKLFNLREELNKFLNDVKKVTGEKVDKLRELIKETRREIKKRIQELMGYSNATTALYQASDADEDREAYLVDTLKDISKTLKEKFLVLGERIAQKIQDIKEAVGLRATVLKKQLKELKGQLGEAAGAMKKKVLEIFRPASAETECKRNSVAVSPPVAVSQSGQFTSQEKRPELSLEGVKPWR
ncbi:hypothetical protein HPB47_013695 [Ixodes persulcatus]|uniref:Uncharacterized protein n=1 Tax=Ixodes persulcatus TaxID=34615 RepID=A0AC60R1Z3_IXOPE|nr:hypothetical protein HPB47_013695 [Ixodes persulcatus]